MTADPRRRTEDSPVFAALKSATVQRLLTNIRRYRAALKKREPDAQNHFIHRHISILRDAYAAGHQLGVLHYWGEVSQAKAPKLPIDDQLLMKRLAFYAPSVAKMAGELHQAAQAFAESDPMAARVRLQADMSWAGQEDGYWRMGTHDPANPYGYVYWLLEPMAVHCASCPVMASGSPYGPPGSGRNELRQTPGDGNTECGASCKCHLAYGPPDTDQTEITDWGPFIPPDADLKELWPEAFPPLALRPDAEYLSDEQKAALDLFRHGYEQWEIYRGRLPELPEMFDPDSAKYERARIGWEHYTEKQQQALKIIFEALRLWNEAGGADVQQRLQQYGEVVRFNNPYPRQKGGRFGYGPGGGTRIHQVGGKLHQALQAAQAQRKADAWVPGILGDQRSAHVADGTPGSRKVLHSLMKRELTDREVGALVGAQDGAHLRLDAIHGGSSVTIRMTDPQGRYSAIREVYVHKNGMLTIGNVEFNVARTGQGLGTRIFADQVRGARRLGVQQITTYAARSMTKNGYITWAKLGYQGKIAPAVKAKLPKYFQHMTTIQQMMRTEEGRLHWQLFGNDFSGTFSLAPGSTSMKVLSRYLRRKGQDMRLSEPRQPYPTEWNGEMLDPETDPRFRGSGDEIEWTAEDDAAANVAWDELAKEGEI